MTIIKVGDVIIGKDSFDQLLGKQFKMAKDRFEKMSKEIGTELFDNMKDSKEWGILKGYEDMGNKKLGDGTRLPPKDIEAIRTRSGDKRFLVASTLAKAFIIDISSDGKSFIITVKGEPNDRKSAAYHVLLFERYGLDDPREMPINKLKWQIKNKWQAYIKEIFKNRVIPGDKRKKP